MIDITPSTTLPAVAPNTVLYVLLHDDHPVPKALFDGVRQQVLLAIPNLFPGVAYALENLCAPDYWDSLNVGDRRTAGRCLAHLVEMGMMPLTVVKKKQQYPLKYQQKHVSV